MPGLSDVCDALDSLQNELSNRLYFGSILAVRIGPIFEVTGDPAVESFKATFTACNFTEDAEARDEQIDAGKDEAMCNPILQAMVLNHEKTEFNILLGLCVGHDSMFFKYADALCTVLAVKDRVLGHNPLAAIYNVDSYYRSIK